MNNDQTVNLLYLLNVIQRRDGVQLDKRPALIRWLTVELNACGDVATVLERYELQHKQK